MTTEEIIDEIENIRKFNYTLAPDEVFDKVIKALQMEPCEDAISRQAVLSLKQTPGAYGMDIDSSEVEKLPPVTPNQKTGHWIENLGFYGVYDYTCSCCDKHNDKKTDYCPNCGAKMIESQTLKYADDIENEDKK